MISMGEGIQGGVRETAVNARKLSRGRGFVMRSKDNECAAVPKPVLMWFVKNAKT